MERTTISFNVPNLITIPIMAFLGFVLLGLIWQLAMRATGQSGQGAEASA
jgi:hypothetical protein